MERTAITTLAGLDAERARWDALFAADPAAHVFQSFGWLRAYLPQVTHPWRIELLARAGQLVAALPLLIRPVPHRLLPVAHELTFATNPLGDYQGMLCRPGEEARAQLAFAAAIRALRWDRAALADVADDRIAGVLARLHGDRVIVAEDAPTPCYAIELPADFAAFLAGLGKKTRRNLTRPMRALSAELPALRVTLAGADDAAAHVDAVVDLNTARWGGSSLRAERLRALLRNAHAAGCARVHAIWDGARPVAAGAAFVDPVHGTYGFYLVGHDDAYDRFSPGKALLALLVQDAIEQGYPVFDFMRGGDGYKRSYATRERANRHFTLTRPGVRETLLRTLLPAFGAAKTAALRLAYRPRNA